MLVYLFQRDRRLCAKAKGWNMSAEFWQWGKGKSTERKECGGSLGELWTRAFLSLFDTSGEPSISHPSWSDPWRSPVPTDWLASLSPQATSAAESPDPVAGGQDRPSHGMRNRIWEEMANTTGGAISPLPETHGTAFCSLSSSGSKPGSVLGCAGKRLSLAAQRQVLLWQLVPASLEKRQKLYRQQS